MRSQQHSTVVTLSGANYSEVSQLALEDSGAFQNESRGEGVLKFSDQYVALAEYKSTNEYRVLDSTFARNKAARGAAIGWFSTKAQLAVHRCSFEVGATKFVCTVRLVLKVHAFCNSVRQGATSFSGTSECFAAGYIFRTMWRR